MRSRRLALQALLLASLQAAPALAQNYPSRPIRMLVGFPPGASTDTFARLLATEMQKALGQPVLVENKGGANGTIATAELARAAPDGHTLMLAISSHVTNALYYRNLPYDPVRDFTPINELARAAWVLVAPPSFPASNIAELVALARARPGQIDYASAGESSPPHLLAVLMSQMAGIRMNHVPYRGSSPALVDVMSGRVPLLFSTIALAREQLASGRLKALGISSRERSRILPTVPTIAESGLPGYEGDIWFGIIGPANMPDAVVDRLGVTISRILHDPEVRRRFGEHDAEVVNGERRAFAAMLDGEVTRWTRIFREAGMRPD
jgi:tripartite-type tricarboxylate transporter receptor subunit TctC